MDKSDDNQYQSCAVRIPKTHALYFSQAVDTPTLLRLKYLAIGLGVIFILIYIFFMIMLITDTNLRNDFLYNFTLVTFTNFFSFLAILIMLFFITGGRYSFIGNRIFAALGYPKPWL
ncbi:hypothetical protein J3U07_02090, partial [Gilliamella sp. B2881]|uniref:hypothetical protein n=1 Tax=Gilliamella sp. B2881 TaxID=2817976 RepID=UPI00226A9C17